MLDMHHIVSDGLTYEILVDEFLSLNKDEELPETRLHYKDYSEWQKSPAHKKTLKSQEDYWLKIFSGGIPELPLPLDYDRPANQSGQGGKLHFEIGEKETRFLKTLAKEYDVTLFMILLACFNILLSRITGREDVIIGVPAAGRSHADLNRIIGMFVNTLALRNRPVSSLTLAEFITELKDNTIAAFENQDYQFDELVKKLGLTKHGSRNPIFDVVFAFQSYKGVGDRTTSEQKDSSFIPGFNLAVSHFDLLLIASEANDKLFFIFEYSTELFKENTIESFSGYFKNIVSAIIKGTGIKLSDIEMIGREESEKLSGKTGAAAEDSQGHEKTQAEFAF
jgi:non-ribosomal peptide synthetase component F